MIVANEKKKLESFFWVTLKTDTKETTGLKTVHCFIKLLKSQRS